LARNGAHSTPEPSISNPVVDSSSNNNTLTGENQKKEDGDNNKSNRRMSAGSNKNRTSGTELHSQSANDSTNIGILPKGKPVPSAAEHNEREKQESRTQENGKQE
jgi:hypothetical protein